MFWWVVRGAVRWQSRLNVICLSNGHRCIKAIKRGALASDGFTLVELLVVLTIISLLVGLVAPRVLNYLGDSKIKTTRLQIDGFDAALDLFYLDTGRYPTAEEGLDALIQRPASISDWRGPYLKSAKIPKDSWGNRYRYRAKSDQSQPYEITSLGSDGIEGGVGTAADISSVR